MKISSVVQQEWRRDGDRLLLFQGGSRTAEVLQHHGGWISPQPGTAPGLYGRHYDTEQAACEGESDRAAAEVLDALSDETVGVLRAAGLLP
jgi:hypothetical protein